MRYLPRAVVAGGMGFAVSLLAACGGGAGLLSGNEANNLQNKLDGVSKAVASRNCSQADERAVELARAVGNLPARVQVNVRLNLIHGVSRASQLAGQDCQRTISTHTTPPPTTHTTPPPTTTTTPPPTTTTTPPPTSTTTPPPTTTTTPPPTTTTTPPPTTTSQSSGGGGLSGDGGNGNGGGNGAGANSARADRRALKGSVPRG